MANLAELIKKAAVDAISASKPAQLVSGTVVAVEPLTVKVSDKLTITQEVIIVPEYLTDHVVTVDIGDYRQFQTIHNALKVGDNVIMLRDQGGQRFFILDRSVRL